MNFQARKFFKCASKADINNRVIRNLTDYERQSKTNSMVYLKNFQSNRFEKYDKKVISWQYPKFDKNTWVQGRNWGS